MTAAAGIRPLTASQAQTFEHAQHLARAGQHGQAVMLANALVAEAPGAADAHHLLAMCLAESGADVAAEQSFRAALSLAPMSRPMLLNFSTWLRRRQRGIELLDTLRDALASAPEDEALLMQVGMVELESGQATRAIGTFNRLLVRAPRSLPGWHAIGNAQRVAGHPERALSSFKRTIEIDAGYVPGWVNLGATQRELGRVGEALASFSHASALGYATPEFMDVVAGTLADAGEPDRALAMARETVARHPDFAAGHVNLAHLAWEFGDGASPESDPLIDLRIAAGRQPGNRSLQMAYLRLLLEARDGEQAVEQARFIRDRFGDDLVSLWLAADANTLAGQLSDAGAQYERALRLGGDRNPALLNACARHDLATSRPELASKHASLATLLDPSNQEGWALLSTAWRLLGDAREFWLCDYERFVGFVAAEPPAGASLDEFLGHLTEALDGMHRGMRAPVNQTLRNGSQTRGRLFGRNEPSVVAAETALRTAVETWLSGLPTEEAHPFLGRNTGRVRYSGSWSVKLRSSGRHANHVHPLGWLSSAFYVSLPASMTASSDDAGCLQLGQPLEELGLSLQPRRVIRPRPGWVALFPSYMWHGTMPFIDDAPRLTVAFDMLPDPGGH
ncbi:2OG-Fe(II) oxygenase family protein [Luteimonas sp. RIT-PG2_3]